MSSSQTSGHLRPAVTAEPVAVDVSPTWTPTSDNINTLPEPLRRYIHDLEAVCDPAGDVAEMFRLREENKVLRWECARLAAHVRTKATHANWDEFTMEGVSDTIKITKALIEAHLR